MSYGLSVFLLDEQDARIFGCQDWQLLEDVLKAQQENFADYDDQAEVQELGGLPHAQALRDLFTGNILRADSPSYGWAYELYCASMGTRLNPNPFVNCDFRWYEEIDQFLITHDVPLRLKKLVTDPPFPLPAPPNVGHWSRDAILSGAPRLNAVLDTVRIKKKFFARALHVVREWLESAVAQPNSAIVGVHG
jgi:hypothetical protein